MPGEHVCAVIGSDECWQALATEFVRDGLAAGDQIWYLTDTAAPIAVLDMLHGAGLPVDAAVARGQLAVRSAQQAYLERPPFDPQVATAMLQTAVDCAMRSGYRGFRVYGDMGWAARDVPARDRLLEYERRVAELIAARPAIAVCHYDARLFDHAILASAVDVHPQRRIDRTPRRAVIALLTDRIGLSVGGEVDIANCAELGRALNAMPAAQTYHLDLGGLDFIDVAGTSEIVQFCQRVHPAMVVLHSPPQMLLRVIDVVWPGQEWMVTG